jgi:tRNA nucleotidyltransferase (CCA-adding enzyme)
VSKLKKIFPATVDGLGAAIAYKRLHPNVKVFLKGKRNRILEKFPQLRELNFVERGQLFSVGNKKTSSHTSHLVLEMETKGMRLTQEDAHLFACAIYLSTDALTKEETSSLDVKALAFCFEHGGNLNGISVQISPLRSFHYAYEIMTFPVKNVRWDMRVSQILDIIKRTGFTGFPVIDGDEKIVGIVTKKDVERALKAGIDDLQLVMSIPPVTVHRKASLEKIGELMALHDIGRVVVVDEEKHPIGIITRRDLVRAVVPLKEENELTFDVFDDMKKRLPPFLLDLLKEIGEFADERGEKAYAVGGFVRDLLMGIKSLDVDIVVEGDGSEFAKEFAKRKKVKLRSHFEFKTATLFVDDVSIDVATARTEYYENPGALPKVESSNLRKDLYRRDFTINAMAIALNPDAFGTLIDFFGGRRDLKNKKVRVLHSMSFVEDPTRILRALRYAARFGYTLEDKTRTLLEDAIRRRYLNVLSEARIRNELEKSLKVDFPEDVFDMFQKYGIFDIFPCKREVDFYKYFKIVRKMEEKLNTFYSIILLLLKPCQRNVLEELFKKYGIPKKFLDVFEKTYDISFLKEIEKSRYPSSLFFLLRKVSKEALPILVYENEEVKSKVFFFLKNLKKVKLEKIDGTVLKNSGFKGTDVGKAMKEILRLKLDENMDEFEALKKILKGDKN